VKPLDLLAFGEVLWDIFRVDTKDGADDFRRTLGGAPANVAVQVARLGGRAAVVGAVGQDPFGDELAARLRREDVDVTYLVRRPERTGIAFILRTKAGQPRFLFYRQATADMAYAPSDLPRRLPEARFALVGSSTLVRPALANATWRFLERAQRGNASVIVDLNLRGHLWPKRAAARRAIASLLRVAHVVKASADDLAALEVGAEAKAIAWVRRRAPKAIVLVTRGAARASAYGAFGAVSIRVPKVRCVDATGAGDAFIAGVVRMLSARGRTPLAALGSDAIAAALQMGVAMGSRVVQGLGATGVDTRALRSDCRRLLGRFPSGL
jgi:fructokinase